MTKYNLFILYYIYIQSLFSHDTGYFVSIVDDQIHFILTLSSCP